MSQHDPDIYERATTDFHADKARLVELLKAIPADRACALLGYLSAVYVTGYEDPDADAVANDIYIRFFEATRQAIEDFRKHNVH